MDFQTQSGAEAVERSRTTAKDFFLQLGIFIALYVSIVSFITLWFQIIDTTFADNLIYYRDTYSSGLRAAISALIIFFPVYLILGWVYGKDVRAIPEKANIPIRRVAVYFTLFAAGLTMLIDLAILLNSFLGGEITSSFIWKILVVFITAALVFGYYIIDIRKSATARGNLYKTFSMISAVVVVASLVTAFAVIGSPATLRAKRFDAQRASDLQQIQYQIASYWQQKRILPLQIVDLNNSFSGYNVPMDPETKQLYEYRAQAGTTFEICAAFSRSNRNDKNINSDEFMRYAKSGFENESWLHDAGRTCFTRTIDPDMYPPIK